MPICQECGLNVGPRMMLDPGYCPRCAASLEVYSAPRLELLAETSQGLAIFPVSASMPAPRNVNLAVLLAALFGPLGLVYSSLSGAVYTLAAGCLLMLTVCKDWMANNLSPIAVIWPLCAVWAALAAISYNDERR